MKKTLKIIGIIIAVIVSYVSIILGYSLLSGKFYKHYEYDETPLIEDSLTEQKKEVKVGEEFFLRNGKPITIKEVAVGNYSEYGSFDKEHEKLKRAQVSIRVHSESGPLSEEEYNTMYIVKNNQLIKLSNSKGAYWGQYWFEMPKTEDFDNMKLYFGEDAVVLLEPYIREN